MFLLFESEELFDERGFASDDWLVLVELVLASDDERVLPVLTVLLFVLGLVVRVTADLELLVGLVLVPDLDRLNELGDTDDLEVGLELDLV